jgi:PmbA protein
MAITNKTGATTQGSGKAESPADVARLAVEIARKKGAKEVAAAANRKREVEVTWRDGKLEKISEATTRGLALQLYVDGRYAQVSTSDLRPEALPPFIENAIALTRALAPDPLRTLPDPALYKGQSEKDLELLDAGYESLTPEERRRQAREMEEAARAKQAGGKGAILSVTSGFADTLSETYRVTSNGFAGTQRDTVYQLYTEVSVKDPDGRRPEDYALAAARHLRDLPAARAVGAEAAERALQRVGAKKSQSAVMSMVVDRRAAGRLAGFFGMALSGQQVQQKRSFLEGKIGTQVGSPLFTVADDPLIVRGLGSRLFDSEGLAARRRPILEGGVLRGFYIDTYYGKKLKQEPTTGRMTNLAWAQGAQDQAKLIAGIKDGVLVTGFLGGNSNSTTGDFSLGVLGFRVRGGKVAEPVGEMNISGNHLELWKHLVAVGNDPYPYSPTRTPSLVFEKVQFAGT